MHETYAHVALALPIADRRRAHDFYIAALGLRPVGPPGSDGLPEPLRLRVNDHLDLVLVPTRGFGWVVGDREVARDGVTECLVRIEQPTPDAVRALVDRARAAGAHVVSEPAEQPWGFEALVADPDGHLWAVAAASGATPFSRPA